MMIRIACPTSLRKLIVFVTVLLAFAFSQGASAGQPYSFTGSWYLNRGLIDLPINGGPVACAGNASTGCVGGFRPSLGGIPGSGVLSQTGAGPASFTVPVHAFGQALGPQKIGVPTAVQLATSLTYDGPADGAQAAAAVPTFIVAQPAVFQKDAWSNDPGQAARLAAAFSWCPGVVGGPACPIGTSATPAAVQGIVKYTPGPNQFGGTMAMLASGSGVLSSVVGTFTTFTAMGAPTMTPLLARRPFTMMNLPQNPGVSYIYTNTLVIQSGPIHIGFMTSVGGLITATGPTQTTGGAPMSPVLHPGSTSIRWGLPWTTGTVSVMNTEMGPGASIVTTTLTAMGSDARTPAGRGALTMVAGGTAHRVLTGQDIAFLDVVTFEFSDVTNLPSLGAPGLVTLVVVLTLTIGMANRRRFSGKEKGTD